LYNQILTNKKRAHLTPSKLSKDVSPQTAEAWMQKGQARFAQGMYEEAIQAFDKAIELKPKLVEAFTKKGDALFGLRKHD
jgi:protein O-GlcNAc transferase